MEFAVFLPILVLTVIFGYLNSLNGSASIVATLISSRALSPWLAVGLTAASMFLGTFVLGVAVATTMGVDLVTAEAQTVDVLLATLIAAIIWVTFAVWLRIPSSATQAFVGSLAGVVWIGYSLDAMSMSGFGRVLLALFLSPVLGIVGGYWLVKLFFRLGESATPGINKYFKRGQILMCIFLAVSYGANDGQKIMGILAFGLIATKIIHTFAVPEWVIMLSATTMVFGTLIGSWRLIRTLGDKFYRVQPVHGFGAQMASGVVLLSASLLGGPVSSSQVIASAIVGAGSAQRVHLVRWAVVRRILTGWVFTLPISATLGALVYSLIHNLI